VKVPALILTVVGFIACSAGANAAAPSAQAGSPIPGVSTIEGDQAVEALLRDIVRQVTLGQLIAPEGDNAMASWGHILDYAFPASPATKAALSDFATYARVRAAAEQAGGRPVIASDMSVFADQAEALLQPEPNAPPGHAQDAPKESQAPVEAAASVPKNTAAAPLPKVPETASLIQEPAAASVPKEPETAPPIQEPAVASVPKEPKTASVPKEPAAASVPKDTASLTMPPPKEPANPSVAVEGAAAPPAISPAHRDATTDMVRLQAEAMASRGDAMLGNKDISAARGFYDYAARAGSARAARALAETYDPVFLKQSGVVGPKPNPTLAAEWYRKAASLGDQTAEARLRTLEAAAVK
jgi:hypothetical protein